MADIREAGLTVEQEIELAWMMVDPGSTSDFFENEDFRDTLQAPAGTGAYESHNGVFVDDTLRTEPTGMSRYVPSEQTSIVRFEAIDGHAEYIGQTGTPVVDVYVG